MGTKVPVVHNWVEVSWIAKTLTLLIRVGLELDWTGKKNIQHTPIPFNCSDFSLNMWARLVSTPDGAQNLIQKLQR